MSGQTNKELARDIVITMIDKGLIYSQRSIDENTDQVVKAWDKVLKAVAGTKE